MSSNEKADNLKVEGGLPHSRRAKLDGGRASQWREQDQSEDSDETKQSSNVDDLANEAEAVRREAVGEEGARNAFGSEKASDE